MENPWFREGLRFACTRCGACCTGAPGYVWVTPDEVTEIADFVAEDDGRFARTKLRWVDGRLSLVEKPNGDCVFYSRETAGCTIYPVRPAQCRTWPFWRSNIASPAEWERTSTGCPGIGKGPLYGPDEVVCLAGKIDV